MDALINLILVTIALIGATVFIYREVRAGVVSFLTGLHVFLNVCIALGTLLKVIFEALAQLYAELFETVDHILRPKKKPVASRSLTVQLPPRKAELLLRFIMKPRDQEVMLGDMQEIFLHMLHEYGPKTARRWYIWQTTRSVWAVVAARIAKWGVLTALGETIRRIISS